MGFQHEIFDLLKIIPDVLRWCGIVLKVFPGSQKAFSIILGYFESVFEKKKSKVEIRLENEFLARKVALARKIAWVGRKT